MSKLFGSARYLMNLADEKCVDQDSFNILVGTGLLADIFDAAKNGSLCEVEREDFRKMIGLGSLEIQIIVDYSLNLKQMISAGNYDWIDGWINADSFLVSGNGVCESVVELIHLNRAISSDDAEKELVKMKLRPAKIEELLAFGAKYPETQKKFPIIALGSVASVDGSRLVADLYRSGAERSLYLFWRTYDWDTGCRFLAIRN